MKRIADDHIIAVMMGSMLRVRLEAEKVILEALSDMP
jgi:hypothetical protein